MKPKLTFLPMALATASILFGGVAIASADDDDDRRYRGRHNDDDDRRYRGHRHDDDDRRHRYRNNDSFRFRAGIYITPRYRYNRAEALRDEWIRDQRRYYGRYRGRDYCPH